MGEAVVMPRLVAVDPVDPVPGLDDEDPTVGEARPDGALSHDAAARTGIGDEQHELVRATEGVDPWELLLGLVDHCEEVVAQPAVGRRQRRVVVRDRRRCGQAGDGTVGLALPVVADRRHVAEQRRIGLAEDTEVVDGRDELAVRHRSRSRRDRGHRRAAYDGEGQRATVDDPQCRSRRGRRARDRPRDGEPSVERCARPRVGREGPAHPHQAAVRELHGVRRAPTGRPVGLSDHECAAHVDRGGYR